MKLIFDTLVDDTTEDSGCAHILEFDDGSTDTNGMFVRVQSWSDTREHPEMSKILQAIDAGKQVRVTVEIIDD